MKIERPLKSKEIKILDKRLKELDYTAKRRVVFLSAYILVALIVGLFGFSQIKKPELIYFLIGTMIVYIVIGVWEVANQYLKTTMEREGIVHLKEKNIVTAIEVRSGIYVEFSEEDDEGVYYFFQYDANNVFSFGGQDFYPSETFPSDHFEIVQGFGANNEIIFLETFNYGKRIKPARIVSHKEKWNVLNRVNYPDPDMLTFAPGTIVDFIKDTKTPQDSNGR
jgi:hypothetical protein